MDAMPEGLAKTCGCSAGGCGCGSSAAVVLQAARADLAAGRCSAQPGHRGGGGPVPCRATRGRQDLAPDARGEVLAVAPVGRGAENESGRPWAGKELLPLPFGRVDPALTASRLRTARSELLWPRVHDGSALSETLLAPSARSAGLPGTVLGSDRRTFELAWGDVDFEVPQRFYFDYLVDLDEAGTDGHGLVSSVEDALDWLWPNFRAAAAAQGLLGESARRTWFLMLRCWHLPTNPFRIKVWTDPSDLGAYEDLHAQFFRGAWDAEAPEKSLQAPLEIYFQTMLLVATYHSQIEDGCTGNARCQGLGSWVGEVLKGTPLGTPWNELPIGYCLPQILIRNRHSGFVGPMHVIADGDLDGPDTWLSTCEVPATGYRSCVGDFWSETAPGNDAWDQWQPVWASGWYGSAADGSYAGSPTQSDPMDTGGFEIQGYASWEQWTVSLPPIGLAWDAFVIDHLLFKARMAYDYSRWDGLDLSSGARHQLQKTARRFARLALARLVTRGKTLIHELGHIHAAGPHCTDGDRNTDCCMEFAAQRWKCAVTAMLGLPTSYKVDFTGVSGEVSDRHNLSGTCDAEPEGLDPGPWTECIIHRYGAVGGTGQFCCSACGAAAVGALPECFDV